MQIKFNFNNFIFYGVSATAWQRASGICRRRCPHPIMTSLRYVFYVSNCSVTGVTFLTFLTFLTLRALRWMETPAWKACMCFLNFVENYSYFQCVFLSEMK